MPNTSITKKRLENNWHYNWKIYIFIAVMMVIASEVAFTSTEYHPPNENKVTIMFVDNNIRMDEEQSEALAAELLARVSPQHENLEAVELLGYPFSYSVDGYSFDYDKFYIQLTHADNDAFITSNTFGKKLVEDGFALPLDEYIAAGTFTVPDGAKVTYLEEPAFDEDGNKIIEGIAKPHLYLISTDPLIRMKDYTRLYHGGGYSLILLDGCANPEATLAVIEELFAELSTPAQDTAAE